MTDSDLARDDSALRTWWKLGWLSFGGPAAQIALMHRLLVEERRWLSEQEFLNALSFCMLLPGPEAMQLATYAGWRRGGVTGGLLAGLLFVLPGAAVIVTLGILYGWYGEVPLVDALFLGIKAAVLVIVFEALLKVGRRALHSRSHYAIAALAFVGIFFLQVPFPLIVLLAGLYGFWRVGGDTAPSPVQGNTTNAGNSPAASSLRAFGDTCLLWLLLWWLPVLALWLTAADSILLSLATFFSRLAVVTFGGAYAVLAYMAQDVVGHYGWLSPGEMLDGLGLAETTPGPLILVTVFVGYLASFKAGGLALGIGGALVTLWVTFIPCFLWIFAGAPYIEWLRTQPRLRNALAAITAAVVGVILNLSVWFTLHVVFTSVDSVRLGPFHLWLPDPTTLDWRVPILAAIAALLLFRRRQGVFRTLVVAALAGLLLSLPHLF